MSAILSREEKEALFQHAHACRGEGRNTWTNRSSKYCIRVVSHIKDIDLLLARALPTLEIHDPRLAAEYKQALMGAEQKEVA